MCNFDIDDLLEGYLDNMYKIYYLLSTLIQIAYYVRNKEIVNALQRDICNLYNLDL